MIKKSVFAGLLLAATSPLFAGGLLTNTNQSVHFLRNPARDASTEIDAVYTNPAGLTFLSDGFHFSLNSQSAYQTRIITSTFAPFAANNGGNATKEFRGEASAPVIPSFQFAYKNDRYVVSASFAVSGGGGKAVFNHGLPSFEAPVSMIPLSLSAKGVSTTTYSVDQYMEGRQYIFGVQLNGSYKLNDAFSAALGLRLNIVNNGYKGHLKNIQINPVHLSLNPIGAMMPANTFFSNAATAATGAANSIQPIINGGGGSYTMAQLVQAGQITQAQLNQLSAGLGKDVSSYKATEVQTMYNTAAGTYTASAQATADKYLDCTQSGWGVTPVIGLNYNYEGLNIGAKYEFRSALNVQNKTTVDDTGLYTDGVNTPHDIPAYFAIGADYKITKCWKVSGGYHHFFDSDAKMANDKQQYINGGINEYLFGSEYTINKLFLLSAGAQITRTGVTDNYQSDMSFSLNSYSVGFGGAVNITPDLRLNLAYFFTNYSKWTKQSSNYNNTTLAGTDVYDRTNKVFGIGLDYKF
ncbi:MAG: aromatic hydrocarbon degradation protein [Bacteroidales bacterium]|nr:aromatic hydrocarbon degradation protein [Bacteroidales bacterium]